MGASFAKFNARWRCVNNMNNVCIFIYNLLELIFKGYLEEKAISNNLLFVHLFYMYLSCKLFTYIFTSDTVESILIRLSVKY